MGCRDGWGWGDTHSGLPEAHAHARSCQPGTSFSAIRGPGLGRASRTLLSTAQRVCCAPFIPVYPSESRTSKCDYELCLEQTAISSGPQPLPTNVLRAGSKFSKMKLHLRYGLHMVQLVRTEPETKKRRERDCRQNICWNPISSSQPMPAGRSPLPLPQGRKQQAFVPFTNIHNFFEITAGKFFVLVLWSFLCPG